MTRQSEAESLIILLHGVGSNGQIMRALADAWRETLPGSAFVAPDAPFAFDRGAGRQWFSISGVTEQNRARRIAAARPDFDRVVRREIHKHGFTNRLDRVGLVGFSQGSIMLLDAVATGRLPVGAGVAFAGRLGISPPYDAAPGTRLLLLHGAADAVVPVAEFERALTAFEESGCTVESRLFPNVGHTIIPEAAVLAGEFLRATLAVEPVA
jgi:phospholipase/carboxylesterase